MDDIKVCFGPSCQGKASSTIFRKLSQAFKASANVSKCDCLGACDQANNISYNGTMIRELNETNIDRLVSDPKTAIANARNKDSERERLLEKVISDPFYFNPDVYKKDVSLNTRTADKKPL